jgi:hypothetical protein
MVQRSFHAVHRFASEPANEAFAERQPSKEKRARLAARPFSKLQMCADAARYFVPVVDVPAGVLLVLVPPVPASFFFFSQPTLNRPMLQMTSNAQIFFITTPFLNVVGETHFAGPSCTLSTT